MRKKRTFHTFNVSFLDVICCGFGAILLLFVLTSGRKPEIREEQLFEIEFDLGALRRKITEEEKALKELLENFDELKEGITIVSKREHESSVEVENKKKELKLLLSQLAELEEVQERLLAEMEHLPVVSEEVPIPVPNPVRRQYLTNFKLDGERVLFLIEASGGMLDEDADLAIERLSDSNEEKRSAPKWRRTMRAVEWLFTSLRPPSRYQIYFFSTETESIYPTRAFEWMDMGDREQTAETLRRLREVTPGGSANLEKALFVIGNMEPMPDNIILFVDGLPTQGESIKAGPVVDNTTRIQLFNAAKRQLPQGVPVNVILFPWAGDPAAPSLYWVLASDSRGSFICPAKNWPTI